MQETFGCNDFFFFCFACHCCHIVLALRKLYKRSESEGLPFLCWNSSQMCLRLCTSVGKALAQASDQHSSTRDKVGLCCTFCYHECRAARCNVREMYSSHCAQHVARMLQGRCTVVLCTSVLQTVEMLKNKGRRIRGKGVSYCAASLAMPKWTEK